MQRRQPRHNEPYLAPSAPRLPVIPDSKHGANVGAYSFVSARAAAPLASPLPASPSSPSPGGASEGVVPGSSGTCRAVLDSQLPAPRGAGWVLVPVPAVGVGSACQLRNKTDA